MKIYKNLIFIIAAVFFIGSMSSCETLEDTYREFVGDGETTYIGKADSVKTRGGENRIELSWLLLSDPKVSSYKVYWNNREDSIAGNVVKTDQVDTVRLMFNNMEESYYQFDIFTFDNLGNSSVRSSQIGRVYGDNYKRTLVDRPHASTKREGNNMIVEWMPAEGDLLGIEVEYRNTLDELIEKLIPGDITEDTLSNFPVGGSIRYRSIFLPEPLALDTFYTAPITITFPN